MFSITSKSINPSQNLLRQCETHLKAVLDDQSLGFIQLPHRKELWESCERLANQWRGQVDQYVILGIGGSSMGFQVVSEMLGLSHFIFVDNVDPLHFDQQMKLIKNFDRTGWLVISKSGSTIETLCALEMILQTKKLSPYVAIVTEKKENSLSTWAQKNSYAHLEVPLDVGGRYSVLSPVGMLPAALAGLNLNLFRSGALKAIESKDLVSEMMAQSLLSFERNEWITTFWIYSSRGFYMGRWIQQLWAESLAKKQSLNGDGASRVSTPIVAIGSTDQHSTLQQMMEGAKDKFYWFFRFSSLESSAKLEKSHFQETESLVGHSMGELLAAEAQATQEALIQAGRHSMTIKCNTPFSKDHFEETLGHFFMMMELVVAGIAQALQINAFDQPGVELGKRLAREHFGRRS